jgi:hypothetical protein
MLRNNSLEQTSETTFQKRFKQDAHNALLAGRGDITPKRIAEILEILNDGQWHLLAEIRKRMKLTDGQIKQVADFLREYNFVTIDDANSKAKLNEDVRKFLSQSATQ